MKTNEENTATVTGNSAGADNTDENITSEISSAKTNINTTCVRPGSADAQASANISAATEQEKQISSKKESE